MKIISHRGNLWGAFTPKLENSIEYINKAMLEGFDVEVDVWYNLDKESFFLGHDTPTHHIDSSFLVDQRLWCHAKNIEAMNHLLSMGANCFWHENDKCTMTSKGVLWCFPKIWSPMGITVVFDSPSKECLSRDIFGICVNDPCEWRKLL
jgi:hypothetical protein